MKAFTPIALRESRLKNGIGLRSRRGLSPAKEFGYGEWGYLVGGILFMTGTIALLMLKMKREETRTQP